MILLCIEIDLRAENSQTYINNKYKIRQSEPHHIDQTDSGGVNKMRTITRRLYLSRFIVLFLAFALAFAVSGRAYCEVGPGGGPGTNQNSDSTSLSDAIDSYNPSNIDDTGKTAAKAKHAKPGKAKKTILPKNFTLGFGITYKQIKSAALPSPKKADTKKTAQKVKQNRKVAVKSEKPAKLKKQLPKPVVTKQDVDVPSGFKSPVENRDGRNPWVKQENPTPSPANKPEKKIENRKIEPVDVPRSEKNPGAQRGVGLQFGDKRFDFMDNPMAIVDGRVYICASDPDFKALFDEMGLTYSWFSYSGKLFIYLPHGSITWNIMEDTAKVGDASVKVPYTGRKSYGNDYVPLDTLAMLLDLRIVEHDSAFEIKPGVRVAASRSKTENTIDIQLHSATEIKYDVKYQARPPAVRLTIPGGGYNGKNKKFFVEGVEVRINDKVDSENLYITMEFPPHWKGNITTTSHKNQVLVRMKPNLVYAWGAKSQALNAIDITEAQEQVYLLFKTSGYVQYYWSHDTEEGVLYVDIPFCSPTAGLDVSGIKNRLVKSCRVETYKPDDIEITRLRVELAEGARFMIGPPEDQKDHSFALLIGDRKAIAKPSPRCGGSGIMMANGAANKLIVIDPGHGGSDPGACKFGYKEKDMTLDISKRLAALLARRGWKVILTRYNDSDVTYPGSPDADELQARCDVANKHKAALFVSIHCNASVSSELKGSSYHWYKSMDREVAYALCGSLGPNIGTVDKGPRKDRFFVLSHTRVPSVLVECAFMTNPSDIKILASAKYRQKIAKRLAASINYFLLNKNLARRRFNNTGSDEE